MRADEGLMADLASAILDGGAIDWTSVDSSASEADRSLVDQLKVLAALVGAHRELASPPPPASRDVASTVAAVRAGTPGQWGHLRVLERIGRGAFGEVFRAWDTRLDREVALKLLPAASATGDAPDTTIIEEGRLLARVRHPNVVTIYGAERLEGRTGLWMELVEGRTLQQIRAEGQALSSAEVVDIGIQLSRAIAAVHGAGLLHRDIKAHNVMRAEDGRVVLMDFGAGRELDHAAAGLAGTPLYLAPEVLSRQPATVRSDIYSAGVVLYHMLTGSYPVHARTLPDLRAGHERGARAAVRTARPDVPPKLARVVDRATDPQPERRYENAAALEADLAALKPRPRVVRLTYTLGMAAAIVLVVALGWELRGRQQGSRTTPSALVAGLVGWSPASGATVNTAGPPIIAVLPLKNLSGEPGSDYFADGLTDEIIRNLAVIQGLQVRSSTSSFAFKNKPRNLRDVGEQLGVNLVVEGSVLRAGDRLRVNAQLVQVAGDVPLWAERFDRELEDVFAIQDEISRAIVNKLRLTLGRGQRRYDTNVEAYDLYLKARGLLDLRDHRDASARSAQLFQQVIDRDPAFAPAYAGLANAYASMSHNVRSLGLSSIEAQPIMRSAAVKALELDPLLAEAHAAMGYVYTREFDWQNADESFRRAIDLDPSLTLSYTLYSRTTLRPLGKLDEADTVLQQAMRTDPLSLGLQREIAGLRLDVGRYEEAVDRLQRVRAVDPEFPWVDMQLLRALTFAGRPAEALALAAESKTQPPSSQWHALAYVKAGRRDEAEALAVEHQAYPFRRAIIHAALGDTDRVLEALDQLALVEPHRVVDLLSYPELAGLRGDPRAAPLRRKFRLPEPH